MAESLRDLVIRAWPSPATAALVQLLFGFSGACTYGVAVSAVVFFALAVRSDGAAPLASVGRLAAFAGACTLVEAVAPHGWDNLLLQVAAGAVAWLLSDMKHAHRRQARRKRASLPPEPR